MREISNKLAVSIIVLAVVLSVVFTFGIVQNVNVGSGQTPTVSNSAPSGGEVSLTFTKPKVVEDNGGGEVSLKVLPPRGG